MRQLSRLTPESDGGLRDQATDQLVATVQGWSFGNGHLLVSLSNGTYLTLEMPGVSIAPGD